MNYKKAAANLGSAAPHAEQSLRERAEAALRDDDTGQGPLQVHLSPEAVEQTLHDLRVHQIELELQNEELRRTLAELETTRARYFDFYDLAPVGYCTVDEHGLIAQANLSTAGLLGVQRNALLKQRFAHFIQPSDQDLYYHLRQSVLSNAEMKSVELRLLTSDGQARWTYLQAIGATDEGGAQQMRLVLSDLSELRQRDERIRLQAQALDQIHDTVTITDLNGVVTYLNRVGRERQDIVPAEIPGHPVTAYGDSAQADATQLEIAAATLSQGSWTGKVVNFNADGSEQNYELRTTLVRDDSGKPIAMVGISTDITQKLKLRQELRQREEKIRIQALALDQIQDRVTITDINGVVTYLNQSGRANPEFPGDAGLLGRHVSEYGTSERTDAGHDEIIHTTLTQGSWTGQVGHFRSDGSEALYDLRTTLVKDEAGHPIAMVGVGTDITEKLKLEQELRQREQYLRALLDNFPFQVWLKDIEGHYLAVNQAFASAHGWPSTQSLTGKRFDDLVDPASAALALAQEKAIIAAGISTQIEILLHIKGRPRWFETYKAPIVVDQQLVGTVGYSRDITERKQTELDLLAAKTEAVKANQAKSHFLAAASHDLRQPIFALSLFFESLKKKVAPGNTELVAKVENCIACLSEMLNNLLDVSKLEAGVVHADICDFPIDEMQSALIDMHVAQAQEKGLRLRWRKCNLLAHTDRHLLQRIVGNFLDNAIRHTRKGGVLLACRRHAGRHWIEVWDTGVGIPADKTELIFDAFQRLEDASQVPGSGLGLTIADKTAALLGLQIRMHSQPGRGSMFAIELPLGQQFTTAPPASDRPAAQRLRIALLDDDDRVLQAMKFAFEDEGYQVVAASSGKTLITALGTQAPDILVSDYRLADGENGFDVIETARVIFGSALPALLITGDTDPTLIRNMVARGITVLYKPLQFNTLQAAIQGVIQAASPDTP